MMSLKSTSKSILRNTLFSQSRRNFQSGGAASKLVGRPSLMLPPCFSAVEQGGLEYKFYSPLNRREGDKRYHKFGFYLQDMVREKDLVRFHNRGGKQDVALMHTNWVGSSHGWLALFNKNNRNMSLVNPVSGRSIPLPPLPGKPFLDEEKTLKVILSHSPNDENCRALVIHGKYEFRKAAAFCSPGRCQSWSPLALGWYNDFVYSASLKAFVSAKRVASGWLFPTTTNELGFWDVESRTESPVKTVRAPMASLKDNWQTYLVTVEESGQLFMVRRYLGKYRNGDYRNIVKYNVYSIENDYFGGDGVQVKLCPLSLDDLVMFIGMNHGFAVRASRFPEYRPNCIYFSGGWNWNNGEQNKAYADIYDYSDKKYWQMFDSTPSHGFPFDHSLPWFTLTNDI